MKSYKDFQTEDTLDTPEEDVKALTTIPNQAAKRKRQTAIKALPRDPLDDLVRQAQALLGWDPRITVYLVDPLEVKRVHRDKRFTNQLGTWTSIGDCRIRELGPLTIPSEDGPTDMRMVEVEGFKP